MIIFLKKYYLSLLIVIIITILCLIDTTPLPNPHIVNFDKLVHVIMFLGVSGVIFFDNTSYLKFPINKRRILFGSFLFPAVFAGLIEIMQEYLTSTRFGDWFDFFFGVIGTFFGWIISFNINSYYLLKKNNT